MALAKLGADMVNMPPPPGTPVDEVATPALILDLAVLERNIETMHAFFRERPAKVRNVTKGHKCSEIAKLQMTMAGSVPYGLGCSKVSEAEVMVEAGARSIRMIEQVVGRSKIARLVELARRAHVIALVDHPAHVAELGSAATAAKIDLDVMMELEIGLDRCGVMPGEPALALAREIQRQQSLRFAGIGAHEGTIAEHDREKRARRVRERVQRLLNTREDLERAGIDVRICGAGSTTSWNIAGAMDGITEIDPGSYALMDWGLAEAIPDLEFFPALTVVATVISRAAAARAVIDCGHKALGRAGDGGMPKVLSPRGLRVNRLNSEHGILEVARGAGDLSIGNRVCLIPRYHGSVVPAWDQFICVRHGRVECVWSISARNCHQ
jgi:D-serine deaminase-like pyridoxal phosphate-dependent protein